MLKVKLTMLVFLLAISNSVFASDLIEIKGIVSDNKSKPIPYIFVSIEESDIRVITDIDGNFVLKVPNDTKFPIKLTFSSVNYVSQTLSITKSNYKKVQKIKLVAKEGYLAYERLKKEAEEKREKERLKKTEKKIIRNEVKILGEKYKAGEIGLTGLSEKYKAGEITKEELDEVLKFKGKVDAACIASTVTLSDGEFLTVTDRSSSKILKADALAIAAGEVVPSVGRPAIMPPPNGGPQAEAGLLTAGELNDFTKWKLWEDIGSTDLQQHQDVWKIYPNERYVAQLTNPSGSAIVNAKVTLKDSQGNNIWQTWTDNTGKAELWSNILTDSTPNTGKPYYIEFEYQKQTKTMQAVPFYIRINTMEMDVLCNEVRAVDIDFVVDATGSMGDEIRYLQEELYDVIKKLQENNPHIDLRTGSIFYRDFGDDYIIRKSEFDKDINKTIAFMKQQGAGGGGDYPEAVDVALYESIENRDWRENTLSKIIFLVLDAPPHALDSCIKQVQRQVRIAAMKGIRIVPLVCSGADKSTEYLMRAIALATNGTYVFLTDESGIGDSHIKPTTDKYEVEKLNHILLRVITQFSTPPNCSNDWNNFDSTMTSYDKFISKPYKERPEDNTERIDDLSVLIKIYPTPCDGVLNVETLQNISHLYISDITGKVLQNFELEGAKSFAVELFGYSNGIYFVNAFYQGRWYSLKFLLGR